MISAKNCHFYKILLILDPKEILEGEKMEVETNEDIENETGFFCVLKNMF